MPPTMPPACGTQACRSNVTFLKPSKSLLTFEPFEIVFQPSVVVAFSSELMPL